MDLELLNFLIADLDFVIERNGLYACVQGCYLYNWHKIKLFLSDDKKAVLDFFGYDTTVEYDSLTPNNLYVFLCDSSKLKPSDLKLNLSHFKGGGVRMYDRIFREFDHFLKGKHYNSQAKHASDDTKQRWLEQAIEYFKKLPEYDSFQQKRSMIDDVYRKGKRCWKHRDGRGESNNYRRFVKVQGINTLSTLDSEEIERRWKEFKKDNWGILDVI